MLGGGQKEGGRRDGHHGLAASKLAMGVDEVGRHPVAAQITGALSVVDANREIFVHFKMEVRRVHAVIVADDANLLAAPNLLSLAHIDMIEVAIERIGETELPMLNPGMSDNDDIAPVGVNVAGQDDNAIADRIDGASETLGAPPLGDPIFAQMPSSPKATGFLIAGGIGRGHGKVKPIRRAGRGVGFRGIDRGNGRRGDARREQ